MKFKIYDYENKLLEIETTKEINSITVTILSGDEFIAIKYEDGTSEIDDSSNCRMVEYYDGSYVVSKDKIDKWVNFDVKGVDRISYKRSLWFRKMIREEAK